MHIQFDLIANKQFDWSEGLAKGNEEVLRHFYPEPVETVERISGVQTFLVNGKDRVFVGDDFICSLD